MGTFLGGGHHDGSGEGDSDRGVLVAVFVVADVVASAIVVEACAAIEILMELFSVPLVVFLFLFLVSKSFLVVLLLVMASLMEIAWVAMEVFLLFLFLLMVSLLEMLVVCGFVFSGCYRF